MAEIQRLPEAVCRLDGLYLPHDLRIFLSDLQALSVILQRVMVDISANDGLGCLVVALPLEIGLAIGHDLLQLATMSREVELLLVELRERRDFHTAALHFISNYIGIMMDDRVGFFVSLSQKEVCCLVVAVSEEELSFGLRQCISELSIDFFHLVVTRPFLLQLLGQILYQEFGLTVLFLALQFHLQLVIFSS